MLFVATFKFEKYLPQN